MDIYPHDLLYKRSLSRDTRIWILLLIMHQNIVTKIVNNPKIKAVKLGHFREVISQFADDTGTYKIQHLFKK